MFKTHSFFLLHRIKHSRGVRAFCVMACGVRWLVGCLSQKPDFLSPPLIISASYAVRLFGDCNEPSRQWTDRRGEMMLMYSAFFSPVVPCAFHKAKKETMETETKAASSPSMNIATSGCWAPSFFRLASSVAEYVSLKGCCVKSVSNLRCIKFIVGISGEASAQVMARCHVCHSGYTYTHTHTP